MNKPTKKIIAREFLFLLASLILFFVLFLIWGALNKSSENKVKTATAKIEEIRNKMPSNKTVLAESFRIELDTLVSRMTKAQESQESIQSVVDYFKELYGIPEYALNSKFEKIVSENRQKGVSDKELEKFVENYREDFIANRTKYDSDFAQLSNSKEDIENAENSFFHHSIQLNDWIKLIGIILSISFGLRYIFYGTKWSLKQLRE
jgi:uncharacterized protein YpmS